LLAAARSDLADADLALRLIDTLPAVAQPDAVAAFAAASENAADVDALGGLPDSDLAQWIFSASFLEWDVL
jgi:hypothetical protein